MNQLDTALLVEVPDIGDRVLRVAHRVNHEEARAVRLLDPEEARKGVVHDQDDAQVALAQQRLDIGPEVDRDRLGEHAAARHRDAEPLTHGAARAVGSDEVLRPHGRRLSTRAVANDGGHAVCVLLALDQFRAEEHLCPELLRAGTQHRLQSDLGDEEPLRRAQLAHPLVEVADMPRQLFPDERLDGHDRPVGLELRVRALAHLILDARAAEDLHRALHDERGTRMDGRAGVALDDQRFDSVTAQKHCRGHADQAAAGDQDGDIPC